ncbi:hypothetical protein [Micromonospora sp. NPDC005652]|uniref:hypothetical protein n=1 Tax=Micromonospora sp. NPDC005652 TaxID=3157046 RepID=UPI0033D01EE2
MRHAKVLLVAPLLLPAAACTTTAAGAEPVGQPTPSYWPGQERAMAAAEKVSESGPERWPATYAGVATDLPGAAITVHRVPGGDIDADVRALVPGVTVRFVDAAEPAAVVDRWADAVRADVSWWSGQGVTVRSVWPRTGDCAVVETDEPAKHAAAIAARYPDARVCVEQGHDAPPLTAD